MHITHHGSQNNVTNKLSNIFAPISDQILNIWSNCDMGSRQSAHGTLVNWDWQASWHSAAETEIECWWDDTLTLLLCHTAASAQLGCIHIHNTGDYGGPLSSIPTFLHRLRAWWLSLSRSRYLNFVVILIVFVVQKPSFPVGLELCANRISSRQLHFLPEKHP